MNRKTARVYVRRMFDRTTPRYVQFIDPAFGPLAEGLVRAAAIQPQDSLLDLGCGTGLAAFAAAPQAASVTGVDVSAPLLAAAQTRPGLPPNTNFVRGDMHALPFATDGFGLALASFSFNSADPALAFAEAFRVLQAGGRLVMQEWGARDELSASVTDILGEYSVEEPLPELALQREALALPDAWDDLETVEDLLEALAMAGFSAISSETATPAVTFPDVEAFINYKLAWASRDDELRAMPPEIRELCYSELEETLQAYCADDGTLIWQPEILRVRGSKAR